MVFIKMNGMSLLELLITLSIVAILLTLSVPSYSEWRSQAEFRSALEKAGNMAKYGRAFALTQHKTITLVLDSSLQGCMGLTTQLDCNCHQANQCKVLTTTKQLSMRRYGAELKTKGNNHKFTVTFDGTHGLNFGNALSVSIDRPPHKGKLIISNLGRVRFCTSTPMPRMSVC